MIDQLKVWLELINAQRKSEATGVIPSVRLERERMLLAERILPFTATEFALRIPLTVLPTGMVHIFGTSYSVDPKKVGAPAMGLIRSDTVEIVISGVRCTHVRKDFADDPQRLPEHRQAMLQAVHGERKHNTFKRDCLWGLGEEARNFLERMIHHLGPHSTAWFRPVNQLFALLEEHEGVAMEAALGRCHAARRYTLSDVARELRPLAQQASHEVLL